MSSEIPMDETKLTNIGSNNRSPDQEESVASEPLEPLHHGVTQADGDTNNTAGDDVVRSEFPDSWNPSDEDQDDDEIFGIHSDLARQSLSQMQGSGVYEATGPQETYYPGGGRRLGTSQDDQVVQPVIARSPALLSDALAPGPPRIEEIFDAEVESKSDGQEYWPAGGRRLGSGNTDELAQQAPDFSESDTQARAAALRQARERRELAAAAVARRVARSAGESPSLSPGLESAGAMGFSAINQPSSISPIATTDRGQRLGSATAAPTSTPLDPVRTMFAERSARIAEQQRLLEISERVKQKQRHQANEQKRNAALTPKEFAEKKIKEEAIEKAKKERAAAKAERARIKRNIEADMQEKKLRREAELERRAAIKAEEDRKEAAKKALELQALKEYEEEEKRRNE